MIKRYDITIDALARDTNASYNWPSSGQLQTPEGMFTNQPNHTEDGRVTVNADKYYYYYERSQEYMFISKLVEILKEYGMVQTSKILFYNDYSIHSDRPSNIGISWGCCCAYLSMPSFKDKTSLCLYWNRNGNASWNNSPPSRGFYLINSNGNNVQGKSFDLSTFGTYGVTSSLVIIKNEKTGEFIVTQQKNSCKNDFWADSNIWFGLPDILFAVLNKGSKQIILGGGEPREKYIFDTSMSIIGGLGLGSGRGALSSPPSNFSGFYNTSITGTNTSNSIILPFYISKKRGDWGTTDYDEILLDNEIASLKKARGNFQEYQEYVINNNLYYCVWQMGDYALLFDEGEAVSK